MSLAEKAGHPFEASAAVSLPLEFGACIVFARLSDFQ